MEISEGAAMSETMRGFVCLPIPPQARRLLFQFTERMKEILPDYRFTAESNLHLTLQFLGEIPRAVPGQIATALSTSLGDVEPFLMSPGGAGSFPERDRPRILHVYITTGQKELEALAEKTRGTLSRLGHIADRPFVAHITLGRRRDTRRPDLGADPRSLWSDEFQAFLGDAHARDALTWKVDTVLVMESVLGHGGPTYTPRARVNFG